jgi:hypothetical protein
MRFVKISENTHQCPEIILFLLAFSYKDVVSLQELKGMSPNEG